MSSDQTDDELDSFDKEVKKKAGNRLARRKLIKTQAYKLNITVPELLERKRQARVEKHGFKTISELDRHYYNRYYRKKSAENPVGISEPLTRFS